MPDYERATEGNYRNPANIVSSAEMEKRLTAATDRMDLDSGVGRQLSVLGKELDLLRENILGLGDAIIPVLTVSDSSVNNETARDPYPSVPISPLAEEIIRLTEQARQARYTVANIKDRVNL